MPTRREFTRADVLELLTVLGARLEARNVHGSVYVVGGAAIATTLDDDRRLTSDIDALTSPADVIAAEAARLAVERDLPSNWLNNNARPWIPSESDPEATVTELPGLTVTIASPRRLLAMKMASFRSTDRKDLVALFERLGIRNPEEAADVVDEVYGADHLANPGREESILSAKVILAAAKAAKTERLPKRQVRSGRQGRTTAGRFAPLRRDEAEVELEDEGPPD